MNDIIIKQRDVNHDVMVTMYIRLTHIVGMSMNANVLGINLSG